MDKFQVNLGVLHNEKTMLDQVMNDYEECVELIGHLTRVFNREGYWDFKESLNGIYKRACKHQDDLNSLIECIQQVHDIYMNSEELLVDELVSSNNLNLEYVLGRMRHITKYESYKLIKSLSIRGDINIGIDTSVLLATTTVHTNITNKGALEFKLEESNNSAYMDRLKLFESQTEKKWSNYGDNLLNKVGDSVYINTSSNNVSEDIIINIPTQNKKANTDFNIYEVMLEAITELDKEYIQSMDTEVDEIYSTGVLYEMEMGDKIISTLFKNLP